LEPIQVQVDEECAIKKTVSVISFGKEQKGFYLPKVFFENGLTIGDEVELMMDKKSGVVFFKYQKTAGL
jgi:hypothetical protein